MSVLPVHIEDVTITTDLSVRIPLDNIASNEDDADYDTENSDGIVYRVKEPKATALIFSAGKIVCTGTKSIRDAEEAMRNVIKKLKELGIEHAFETEPDMVIEKIVAAFRLKDTVDLDQLSQKLKDAEYDTQKLPGIVYRNDGIDFIILEKKIICSGGRSIKEIQKAMKDLKKTIEKAGSKVDFV